jgi:hypothetical protein
VLWRFAEGGNSFLSLAPRHPQALTDRSNA